MGKLLLVNEKDEVLGFEDKEKCHQDKGILHRAFAIFIFDDKGRLLIQQRSKFKKLWPLCWESSCASHSRKNETYKEAAERRLEEELGLNLSLDFILRFQYQAPYKNIGSENEICAILIGKYNKKKIKPNPREIANWKFIEIERLKKEMAKNPKAFAPWLKIGLEKILCASFFQKL